MGTKTHNSRGKIFMIYLILVSLSLLGLILPFKPLFRITSPSSTLRIDLPSPQVNKNPKWLRLIRNCLPEKRIQVGFLNIDEKERESYEARGPLVLKNIHVPLDHIPKNVTWKSDVVLLEQFGEGPFLNEISIYFPLPALPSKKNRGVS